MRSGASYRLQRSAAATTHRREVLRYLLHTAERGEEDAEQQLISRSISCAQIPLSVTVPGCRCVQRVSGMTGVMGQAPPFTCFQVSPKSLWEQTAVKSLQLLQWGLPGSIPEHCWHCYEPSCLLHSLLLWAQFSGYTACQPPPLGGPLQQETGASVQLFIADGRHFLNTTGFSGYLPALWFWLHQP